MGFTLTTLYANVRARGVSVANKGIDSVRGVIAGVDRRLDALAAKAKIVFAVAVPAAIAYTIRAASNMEEAVSKFNTVFGESAGATRRWSDGFARDVGRSQRQIVEFMSASQDLFVPLGFGAKDAEVMSKQIARLAVDLGSFNNVADDLVLRDLQAALTGSGEVMKKYGVLVSEAAVKQELLNQSMDPKVATDQQKVLARLNIIMRGTIAAQGDAERTAGSFANQMKRMHGNEQDAATVLGTAMLPAVNNVATAMNNWLQGPGGQKAVDGLALSLDAVVFGLSNIGEASRQVASPMAKMVLDALKLITPEKSIEFKATLGKSTITWLSAEDILGFDSDAVDALIKAESEKWLNSYRKRRQEFLDKAAEPPPGAVPPSAAPPAPPAPPPGGGGAAGAPFGGGLNVLGGDAPEMVGDQATAAMDQIDRARDRITAMAHGARVSLLEALGLGTEAEIAGVDEWLAAELKPIEDMITSGDIMGADLGKVGSLMDALKEIARLRKEAIGTRDEGPQAQAQFMGQQEWVRQIQAAVGSGGDVAKQQLDEAKKQTALTAEQNALIKNLDMAVTS